MSGLGRKQTPLSREAAVRRPDGDSRLFAGAEAPSTVAPSVCFAWKANCATASTTLAKQLPLRSLICDSLLESGTLPRRSRLRDLRAPAIRSIMSTLEIYIERAAQSRHEAATASLENVRERCLRSALAWEAMADQLRVTQAYKQTNEVARNAAFATA